MQEPCRRLPAAPMNDSRRILLVEFVIPGGNEPFVGKWFDLAMMVIPRRTEDEYRRLLEAAGFAEIQSPFSRPW